MQIDFDAYILVTYNKSYGQLPIEHDFVALFKTTKRYWLLVLIPPKNIICFSVVSLHISQKSYIQQVSVSLMT